MLKKINQKTFKTAGLFNASLAILLLFGMTVFGQTANTSTTQPAVEKSATLILQPVLTNYKDVKIGMTDKEVRDKLGKAEIDDKDGFFYRFSDDEFAQIRLDNDKKVRLLAVTYSGENKNAPKYTDVFGADAKIEAKPDGSVYKLIRYPEAGYWVAYSRTAGDKPSVTVTMQKMRGVK